MNVVIVHGSSSKDKIEKKSMIKNKQHWFPWIKKKLEDREIQCDVPLMPESWEPKYNNWKKEFEKISVDENSVLIGTIAGAVFLVRWLGETKKKIKKLILVAPITGKEKCNDWLNKEYGDFELDESIKERVGEVVIFFSDNDKNERLDTAKIYHKKLGGKLIELPGRGHFIEKYMGTYEFPELLEEILK